MGIEQIKEQTPSASQNDRLNLSFVKDTMYMAEKWLEMVVKLQFSCLKFWRPPSTYPPKPKPPPTSP